MIGSWIVCTLIVGGVMLATTAIAEFVVRRMARPRYRRHP